MRYTFFEEAYTADIGFTAEGNTPEELLTAASEATMNVMVDNLADITPAVTKQLQVEASSFELALFDLLGELIFYKDAEELLLRLTQVRLSHNKGRFIVTAEARGEKINPDKHRLLVDVKAVTMHHFKAEKSAQGWIATVVLDI